jgi:DNA-binding MarR family transcriptional regulator
MMVEMLHYIGKASQLSRNYTVVVATTEQPVTLTASLMELHRQMRVILATVARDAGVTAQQIELLCLLERGQPSLGEIARLLGCDKTNITGMVERLGQRGLVTRQPDPRDRRITHLHLTEQGRQLSHHLKHEIATQVDARWHGLTDPERAALTQLATGRPRASV